MSPLFERILENKPVVDVVRDPVRDVWMESETKMVFDPVTRVVLGVFTPDGGRQLTALDLQVARERGWKTVFVENLKQLNNEQEDAEDDD